MSDTELTQEIRERMLVAMMYSDKSAQTLIDILLVAMTDESEKTEEWALNGLRSFGEIRRKYKDDPQIIASKMETIDLLDKMVKFYFDNYEKANGR